MRNVGASNHFIKVPFMIEGVLIGAHRIDHSVCAHLFWLQLDV